MQMMYGIVAQEIRSMNIKDAHPQDYLNFFCLGKRETMKDKLLQNVQSLEKSSAVMYPWHIGNYYFQNKLLAFIVVLKLWVVYL